MRLLSLISALVCLLLASCAGQSLDPTAVAQQTVVDLPWRVHCETDKSYTPDLKAFPGVYQGFWTWAQDRNGDDLQLRGEMEEGFFVLESILSGSNETLPATAATLRGHCVDTINRDEPTDLARVLASRDSRDLDVAIVYPEVSQASQPIKRLVLFGDSLTDTGRLKHRMQVFPGKPYWLGRFSNGPAWPDYLEATTTLAIQNNAYGGASVERPPEFQKAGLLGYIKEGGRFFVSGSLAQQVEVYLDETLGSAQVSRPEETAFLIWAGANDYISKEPIHGLITTFLNTPEDELGYESVVENTLAGIIREITALYAAGARRFILVNMPDLGKTPIPLQNDTYVSGLGIDSEEGRRIELSRRLSVMTDYHNARLAQLTTEINAELADVDILLVDSNSLIDSIFADRLFDSPHSAFDYGFELDILHQKLEYDGRNLDLPKNCYTGVYLGSFSDGDTCEADNRALFWDVVHPATYAHCWQAYQIGRLLSNAGWISSLPAPEDYRDWCQNFSKRDSSG